MDQDFWQEDLINKLKQNFQNDSRVIIFAIFGSTATIDKKYDYWSDVDGLLIVKDDNFNEFTSSFSWIEFLGNIFTYQKQPGDGKQTIRLVFDNFKRLDLVILKESAIKEVIEPEKSPFWENINIIFSKSRDITKLIEETGKTAPRPSFIEQQFEDLVNNFWFVASLSLSKVVRNDLLIAMHLALDLYKDCLLMGMIIRDRETGTNIHKTGGIGNEITKNMDIQLEAISQKSVLNLISQCGQEFDKLAQKWSPDYNPQLPTLEKVIILARKDINNIQD